MWALLSFAIALLHSLRACFRLYSRFRARRQPGRPRIPKEVRQLIRRMALQNPWGARKNYAELAKLGIEVSLATVSRHLPKRPPDPVRRRNWRTIQQLGEAFPNEQSLHDLIRDNDAIFSERLIVAIGHLGIEAKRTADQIPW